MQGVFVAFEGIDGAGLSTHSRLLYEELSKRGYEVLLTKEPTDGLIGGLIKAALRGEWRTDPATLQLLFAADRCHHVNTLVYPALRQGKVVITDRYKYSSIAYGSLDCDREWLVEVNSKFPEPDLLIVLDVPAEIALERISRVRFGFELFENSRLEIVRENFLQIAEELGERAVVVDASGSIEEVHERVLEAVSKVLTSTPDPLDRDSPALPPLG